MYWLPILHKTLIKHNLLASQVHVFATELPNLLTSSLAAIKQHLIWYCEKVYEKSGKTFVPSIKSSGEIINKLKLRGICATYLSSIFSTLYTTLPYNRIGVKKIDLIGWSFQGEGLPFLACSESNARFTSEHQT